MTLVAFSVSNFVLLSDPTSYIPPPPPRADNVVNNWLSLSKFGYYLRARPLKSHITIVVIPNGIYLIHTVLHVSAVVIIQLTDGCEIISLAHPIMLWYHHIHTNRLPMSVII